MLSSKGASVAPPSLQDQAAEATLRFYRRVEGEARRVENALLYEEMSRRAGELSGVSDQMREFAGQAPAELLLHAATAVGERAQAVRRVAEGFRGPFLLFVIGMGKHGKSSLINALVGSKVAPVGVLPKTWKIDVFSAAQPPGRVRILYRDGSEKSFGVEETQRLLAEEEQRRLDSEDQIECEVRWPCHASPVLRHFDIVDTPGLVQELDSQRLYHFRDYYHKAHGVLWMLDATVISSQKARQLIDELDEELERVGGRARNIVGVLNKIDLVGDQASKVYHEPTGNAGAS